MTLSETINEPGRKDSLVAACVQLMDEQVATKGGLSGLAIKAAYGVVKGVGPSYIPGAIERLLPAVLTALNDLWDEGLQMGDPVEHLSKNQACTADAILSITDTRIEKSKNGIVRASYSKLRKSVKGDVEAAVPDLAKIINSHTSPSAFL
jgi:hypothetical protein